jgi:molybdopterin adenylyltransferase
VNISVITISDRASRGVYEDLSGPAIEAILKETVNDCNVSRHIVPDDREAILKSFVDAGNADAIITTGGTGLSPRDITPDITATYCDRLIPGIAEILRSESYKVTPNAMLSRGVAGMKGTTVIVNFPGSVRAAEFCTRLVAPILMHAVKMITGEGH